MSLQSGLRTICSSLDDYTDSSIYNGQFVRVRGALESTMETHFIAKGDCAAIPLEHPKSGKPDVFRNAAIPAKNTITNQGTITSRQGSTPAQWAGSCLLTGAPRKSRCPTQSSIINAHT
jgi:hypothetical protein